MPGVLEASWFRRRCLDATAEVPREERERLREEALAVVACAAAAWRSAEDWRRSRERVETGQRAREAAMSELYQLYRGGKVPARAFDRVAVANAELKNALALLVMTIRERRYEWAK
jgi:hypothetical protein